jgi:cytochrome c oxidase cbb3-type subunit 3
MSKAFTALAIGLLTAPLVMAKGGGSAPRESSIYDPLVLTLLVVMFILLLAIGLLANVVLGAASYYHQREKEREQQKTGSSATAALSIIVLLLLGAPTFAQDAGAATAAVQPATSYGGLSDTTFFFMVGVVAIELLVIFVLLYQLRLFLAKEKAKQSLAATAKQKPASVISVWEKLNKLKPVEQESQIDLGHDYDGIRELDNRLPPWWLYGFYVSIIFAVIYLWRYHVSHSAPLSQQELQIAMAQAEEQKAIYLKNAANNVDENTVKLLTAATDIEAGQKVFTQSCSPCHGKAGEGIVGPNLTDDYWLHGGSIKDVFKTIKYGWPEKGMRSWKDDLSPVQIAQIASYIKSIHGTNPPNAKAQQGELYQEGAGGSGSGSATTTTESTTKK